VFLALALAPLVLHVLGETDALGSDAGIVPVLTAGGLIGGIASLSLRSGAGVVTVSDIDE